MGHADSVGIPLDPSYTPRNKILPWEPQAEMQSIRVALSPVPSQGQGLQGPHAPGDRTGGHRGPRKDTLCWVLQVTTAGPKSRL